MVEKLEKKEGLWLVDKPIGISSFGLVARLRHKTGIRKIGHAGTLDPQASGLMILLAGKTWTKQSDQFLKLDKVYEVELKLGQVSSTGDSEGELQTVSTHEPSLEEVRRVLGDFVGVLSQTPPAHSAIKVGGVRAYKLARAGKAPELAARKITVHSITKLSYEYPYISFTTEVSSGTYIRSLARDIGQALKVGAYMSALKRTQIGHYKLDDAVALD